MIHSGRTQQLVGPERRERVSHEAWCGDRGVNSRRPVNSSVVRLCYSVSVNMKLFSLISFAAILLLSAVTARAQCDCIGQTAEIRGSRYSNAVEDLNHSEVVFVGQVIETREVPKLPNSNSDGTKSFELKVRLKVQRAWKRAVDEYVTLRTNVDDCSIGFEVGARYLVYAVADGDSLRTWYCSRTRLVARAQKDLDEFESHDVKPSEIKRVSKP
jgi:hypothetical protein